MDFDAKEILSREEYSFLKNNELLGKNIILLAFGGSIAYGTNIETSDIDIRGVAISPESQILGLDKDFSQIVETNTDTVIYSLHRLVEKLMECNPNMIEILGCKPEHYLYLDKFGQKVLDHRRDFLSVRAISTFGGYADQQYDRLEHGLLGNGDNDDKKLKMLRDSLDRSIKAFEVAHKSLNMNFSIREVDDNELYRIYPDRERTDKVSNDHLLVSGSFTDIPVTDFKNVISGLHKIQSEYGNINKRNTKKTDEKLAKHMMHLIRLYLMGFDLCTKGEIVTYREKEHDMLMDVRNGKYMTSDGRKVIPEFYELLEDVQSKYEYAIKNCILPEKPNREALNELVIQIVKEKFSM